LCEKDQQKNIETDVKETSYFSTLVNLFSLLIGSDISKQLIDEFLIEYKNNKKELDNCDTNILTKMYNVLLDYVDIVDVETNILHSIREKIENKIQNKLQTNFKNKINVDISHNDFSKETPPISPTTLIILKPSIKQSFKC
jgi:hypothetical protein